MCMCVSCVCVSGWVGVIRIPYIRNYNLYLGFSFIYLESSFGGALFYYSLPPLG